MFYTNPFYGGHTFEIGVLFASDKALPIYHSVAQIIPHKYGSLLV